MLTEKLFKRLKVDGFKKKGLNMRLFHNDIIFVINLQKSQFNDSEESFAVNLSIFSPKIYELCWGKEPPILPLESDGIFRKRAGYFTDISDCCNWYILKNDKDIPIILEKILKCMNNMFVNFIKNISDLSALYKLLNSEELPKQDYLYLIQLACLAHLVGEQENASLLLDTVSSNSDAWKKNADLVRARIAK